MRLVDHNRDQYRKLPVKERPFAQADWQLRHTPQRQAAADDQNSGAFFMSLQISGAVIAAPSGQA